jgi:uracil phosphoribosyltransferase
MAASKSIVVTARVIVFMIIPPMYTRRNGTNRTTISSQFCLCTGPDFFTAPSDLAERLVIVMAPVLATGNTATAAIDRVKERGAKDIRFVCLIAVQQGVERVRGVHPDVRLWTAAIDDRLDERGGFIVPALGDAGDRAYGTK